MNNLEKVDFTNKMIVSELKMLANIIASGNKKYKKYLEATKELNEELGMAIFEDDMDYEKFINEVVEMYVVDFRKEYDNLFIMNCHVIQSHSEFESFKIKKDKIIFYINLDDGKAHIEIEIIDILSRLLISKCEKVYNIIYRQLQSSEIKH